MDSLDRTQVFSEREGEARSPMRRVVEQQLSQVGDLIRWIATEKEEGAKKFPTDKIILSVGNGQGNRDSYNEILPRFTVSGHKEKKEGVADG
mgnify:FL=1